MFAKMERAAWVFKPAQEERSNPSLACAMVWMPGRELGIMVAQLAI
jgi:hypothetical protein